MDADREGLRRLSRRLLRLHKTLLDRERDAYEARHGAVSPGDLLRLLLHDEQFAWLRPLSSMIARIDELVDGDEPPAGADARAASREASRLLKSGDRGVFQDRYRDALQASADVVLAHADVSAALATAERPPID